MVKITLLGKKQQLFHHVGCFRKTFWLGQVFMKSLKTVLEVLLSIFVQDVGDKPKTPLLWRKSYCTKPCSSAQSWNDKQSLSESKTDFPGSEQLSR